jgi:hypothetical protein
MFIIRCESGRAREIATEVAILSTHPEPTNRGFLPAGPKRLGNNWITRLLFYPRKAGRFVFNSLRVEHMCEAKALHGTARMQVLDWTAKQDCPAVQCQHFFRILVELGVLRYEQ